MLWVWMPSLVLLAAAAGCAWWDARTLRTGVLLLAGTSLAGLTLLGTILQKTSNVNDPSDLTAEWILLGVLGIALASVLILALVLTVNGVVLIRREGASPAHALSLAMGLGIIAYAGVAFLAAILGSPQLFLVVVLLGFPLMYLSFVFTAFVTYAALYLFVTRRWGGPVDAVIVLGAGLRNGRVTPLLRSRLDRGIEVFARSRQAGRTTILVPSGGKGADEPVSEAAAMAAYLVEQGIAPDAIVAEDRSRTTWENVRFSKALLDERGMSGRAAVATNNFHAFRAAMLMRKARLKGYATGSPTASYFWPAATIREFLAVLRDHKWLNGFMLVGLSLPLIVAVATMVVSSVR
ncbi:MAG: YdcF family protein [Thermomicrobiales bacterium]